jgi:hypothetical protein
MFVTLYNIIARKKYLSMAGENIVLANRKKIPKWMMITVIISLPIFGILIYITTQKWLEIIILLPNAVAALVLFLNKLYEKINGIYKNGIIFNEYIEWNEIHNYRWINEEKILLFKKNGEAIDFDKVSNKEKLIETLVTNKVSEIKK